MEKISWTEHVRNEDVLLRVKEQRNILHEISKRKANWIGHILRTNCKYYVERKGDTPSMHYPAAREAELVDFCRDCII